MAESERKQEILDYLRTNGKATVEDLAKLLYVSTASIRRDLTQLQAEGFVKRTHGGVLYNSHTDATSVNVRKMEHTDLKEKTAEIALSHIPDFETAFVDDSSTGFTLMEKLNLKNKTIITNGFYLAMYLAKKGINVIIPGGTLQASTGALNGAITIDNIRDFRFDACFLSCLAIDDNNTYESSMDIVSLKSNVLKNSKTKILLADSSKIGKNALFASSPLSFYNYIFTDAPDDKLKAMRENGALVVSSPKTKK